MGCTQKPFPASVLDERDRSSKNVSIGDPNPTSSGVKGYRVYSLVAIDVYNTRHILALTHEANVEDRFSRGSPLSLFIEQS